MPFTLEELLAIKDEITFNRALNNLDPNDDNLDKVAEIEFYRTHSKFCGEVRVIYYEDR